MPRTCLETRRQALVLLRWITKRKRFFQVHPKVAELVSGAAAVSKQRVRVDSDFWKVVLLAIGSSNDGAVVTTRLIAA